MKILIISLLIIVFIFLLMVIVSVKKKNKAEDNNINLDFNAEQNIISLINTGMTLDEIDNYNLKLLRDIIKKLIVNDSDYSGLAEEFGKRNINLILTKSGYRYKVELKSYYKYIDSDRHLGYIDIPDGLYEWFINKKIVLTTNDIIY